MAEKILLDGTVVLALKDAWKGCRRTIGTLPIRLHRVAGALARLHRFPCRHDSASVTAAASRICQGVHLVISALEWSQAAIGAKPHPEANTQARALGEVWRLTVAYTGFERVAKAICRVDKLEQRVLDGLIDAVALAAYGDLIPAPERSRGTRPSNAGPYRSNLVSFLHGRPVADWKGAIGLAQSLRHVVAHGALSPNKVTQHSLRRPIVRLTADVGRITTAIIEKFAE